VSEIATARCAVKFHDVSCRLRLACLTEPVATASQYVRIALALACGVTGAVVAVVLGHSLAISQFAWDWLMLPTAPAFLSNGPVGADVVLNLVKVVWVLASAVLIAVRSRESKLCGLRVALVMLLANASVQILKHWPGQPPALLTGLEPLSGHAALVGAVALTWLVTARNNERLRACVALACVTLTCLAAIVLGLHSPIQVACPLVVCLGWALALLIIQPAPTRGPEARQHALGGGVAVVGVALVLLSLVMPAWWPATLSVPVFDVRLLLVAVFVSGSALFVVGVAVAGATAAMVSNSDPPADRPPARACDALF